MKSSSDSVSQTNDAPAGTQPNERVSVLADQLAAINQMLGIDVGFPRDLGNLRGWRASFVHRFEEESRIKKLTVDLEKMRLVNAMYAEALTTVDHLTRIFEHGDQDEIRRLENERQKAQANADIADARLRVAKADHERESLTTPSKPETTKETPEDRYRRVVGTRIQQETAARKVHAEWIQQVPEAREQAGQWLDQELEQIREGSV